MAYKFIKTKDPKNKFDITDVAIRIQDGEVSRSDLLETFEEFLKACGFYVDGNLEIIKEDNPE